jgi:hypothetical protein
LLAFKNKKNQKLQKKKRKEGKEKEMFRDQIVAKPHFPYKY